MKSLRVSIVIPVYNEAAHLPACLDAIAAQTVQPYEVIVVDNNSTDDTAAIAAAYPFVGVIREKRQGVVYARDRGFDAVSGDIIGRIDADSVISDNWVETLQNIFADQEVGAVTGSARYYGVAAAKIIDKVDLVVRSYQARVLGREVAMQGANMALRTSIWKQVRSELCRRKGIHEDFDLAIHINWQGFKVVFDKSLVVSLANRRVESSYRDFVAYCLVSPKTYALHGLKSSRRMHPVVALVCVCYIPLRVLYKGYNPITRQFSFVTLIAASRSGVSHSRVNPATFVD